MRKLLSLIAVVVISYSVTSAAQAKSVAIKCPGVVKGVYFYRDATHNWQQKMGAHPTRSNFNASRVHSCKYTRWVARVWVHRAFVARKHYLKVQRENKIRFARLYKKYECIHKREGAWNSVSPDGIYHGGLQMDYGFQKTYGPEFLARWGQAENWPVYAQLTAAERAYWGFGGYGPRYFGPWPTQCSSR